MEHPVVVLGAGIVGVSTAIWLQRAGKQVVLVDRGEPGDATSYGNGGVLASCSIIPVTVPGLIGKAPKMLLDRDEPLFLKWRYLPKLFPWLMRYLSHANEADVKRIASALHAIVGDSLNDHMALAAGTGAEAYVEPADYAFIYRNRAHFQGDAMGWGIRAEHGFTWRELEGEALRRAEPALTPEFSFAASLSGHGRIRDPGAYVKALARHVQAKGGRFIKGEAQGFVLENGRATGLRVGGETIPASAIVVATGPWSGLVTKQLGLSIPMESERGYHLDLIEPSITPNASLMIASKKFVVTPMDGRLRLAGIVEFGGFDSPPSRAPFELLERHGKAALPGLTWREKREWMGHRPAITDSIPVIGEIPSARGVFCGFGHHHVGLTGGPRTGQILGQLIAGQTPNLDLAPYRPARFSPSKDMS